MQIARPYVPRRRIHIGSIVITMLLILVGIVILMPFYWMLVASTLSLPELVQYPPRLLPGNQFLVNVRALLERLPFLRAYVNSLFIAAATTAAQLFLCSLGGYAFAKYDFPGREKFFVLMLATMMIPAAVGLVPWYIMMSWFHWVDSYLALIVPSMASAFGIFWMRQFISGAVPDEMIQAARVDGCSDFGIYWRIVVPVILPGLGALGIMIFMGAWNDFMAPLIILRTLNKYTITLILALLMNQFNNEIPLMMAGATLATVPVLIVFFAASGRFISGLTAGSVKS
jgi:cellobiose transport system permease protein